jgi:hypothetical protein
MRVLSYLSALFLIMLVGCSDQSEETAPTQTTTPEEATLDFVVITEGATSGVQTDMTSIYRLDTQEAWHKFWLEHSQNIQPSEAAPTINFEKDMVVAIVDADQPSSGYQLTIDQLQAVDDKLYVFATRTQPGAGCVSLGMISQPFVIIQLPKADLIPELRLSTKTVPCE